MSHSLTTVPSELVLLPGLDGTGRLLEDLNEELSGAVDCRVVSYPTVGPQDYTHLLNDVVTQSTPSKPFFVLGESFSGALAIRWAAQQPPGLRGLILCAAFVRNPWPAVPRWTAGAVGTLLSLGRHARGVTGWRASRGLVETVSEIQSHVPRRIVAARLKQVLCCDVQPEFASLTLPILHLVGRQDTIVPAWNARHMQTLHPNMQTVSFSSGHLILQTRTAVVAVIIRAFIQRLTTVENTGCGHS